MIPWMQEQYYEVYARCEQILKELGTFKKRKMRWHCHCQNTILLIATKHVDA